MRRRRKFLKSMMLVVILPSKTSLFMRRRRKFLHNHGTQTPSKLPKHPPKYRKHPPKYPKHPQNTPKPPNLRSEILLTRGGFRHGGVFESKHPWCRAVIIERILKDSVCRECKISTEKSNWVLTCLYRFTKFVRRWKTGSWLFWWVKLGAHNGTTKKL